MGDPAASVLARSTSHRDRPAPATGADRSAPVPALTDLMRTLRSVSTTADLLDVAPREIARVGYDRCMVSRVHRGRWIARSAYVTGDDALADAITRAGSEAPVELDRAVLESEMVHRRTPMIVRDAQRNPRAHRRLMDVTGTTTYVAAPVEIGADVVGFVHVDRHGPARPVDETDLAVLGMITECLGFALERTIHREEMQALRLARVAEPVPDPALGTLSAREREVLERIAAGESNADIGAGLFITQATVKAHVKHIFRKLAVANRAEAVSRYLRG